MRTESPRTGQISCTFVRAARLTGQKSRARKSRFPEAIQADWDFHSWPENIAFRKSETVVRFRHPALLRGALAIVTNVGRDAVDAAAQAARNWSQGGLRPVSGQDRAGRAAQLADGKTVWSWHPLLVSSRRRLSEPDRALKTLNPPATVTIRIRRRGATVF
jgi:hypothetical protein